MIDSNGSVVQALRALLRDDEISAEALQSHYVNYLHAEVMDGGFSTFVYNSR